MFEENPDLRARIGAEAWRLTDLRWDNGDERSAEAHDRYHAEVSRQYPGVDGLVLPHPSSYKPGDIDFGYCSMMMSRQDLADHIYGVLLNNTLESNPKYQRTTGSRMGLGVLAILLLSLSSIDKKATPWMLLGAGVSIAGAAYAHHQCRRVERTGQ